MTHLHKAKSKSIHLSVFSKSNDKLCYFGGIYVNFGIKLKENVFKGSAFTTVKKPH